MADMRFDVTAIDRASVAFEKVAAGVELLAGRLDALDRKDVNVKVKVQEDDSFKKLINDSALLQRNLKQFALPVGALAALPGIASMGSAIVQLTGVLGVVPAAAMAAAAAVVTAKIGFQDFGDAIGKTDTPANLKKVNEAMAELAPNARATAKEVQALKPAFNDLKLDVQDKLFKGMADTLKGLSASYLPVLKTGFGGLAVEMNKGAQSFADWAKSSAVVRDVGTIFDRIKQSMPGLSQAGVNVASSIKDIGVVGAQFLPGIANALATATTKFKIFVEQARADGSLQQWIQRGMNALSTLGDVVGNVGKTLGGLFKAADTSGASFLVTLKDVTGALSQLTNSTEGQKGLVDFFKSVRQVVNDLIPGARALLTNLLQGITNAGPAFDSLAKTISGVATALAPSIPLVAQLASMVLPPLLTVINAIVTALGPLAPLALTAFGAFKVFTPLAGVLDKIGTSFKGAGTAAGYYALKVADFGPVGAAAQRTTEGLGSTIKGFGAALPLIGVAVIALGAAFSAASPKTDDWAQALAKGEMSLRQLNVAVAQHNEGFWTKLGNAFAELGHFSTIFGDVNLFGGFTASAGEAIKKADDLRAAMSPLERAQADAATAQAAWNAAIDRYTANSPQAAAAADIYAQKSGEVKRQQDLLADATKSATDRMIDQQNQMLAATNADLGYQQSVLDVKRAQDDLALAITNSGAKSDEAKQAQIRLEQAQVHEAESAGRAAGEAAKLAGDTNSAAVAAEIQKNKILDLASAADGSASPAMINLAHHMSDSELAAHNAMVATSNFHFEVRTLPDGRKVNIWTDDAVKAMGDTKNFHSSVDNLPVNHRTIIFADGSFSVSGTGVRGNADGGILPGYTPGRDVHISALSGGEAVMRPEWTVAVGHDYVHAMNAAARAGGIGGVRRMLGFADGGIVPTLAFANGGVAPPMSGFFPTPHAGEVPPPTYRAVEWQTLSALAKLVKDAIAKALASIGTALGSGANVAAVMRAANEVGWGTGAEWAAITQIVSHESGWNNTIKNPNSTAYGLFQFLDSTWGTVGGSKTSDPYLQGVYGMRYMRKYGDAIGAWNFWQAHHWYGDGGIVDRPTFGMVGEDGPEAVIPLSKPNRAAQVMQAAGLTGGGGRTTVVHYAPTVNNPIAERGSDSIAHAARVAADLGLFDGRTR